ncbi:MAG TPA: thioesterase domain-containing protein, partial [Thermoanaerobaculia bacterium]|nr:thioesterase domain-containing protein [Thermoanaerobaculia bacterium]
RPALDLDALVDGLPRTTRLHAVPALMREIVERVRARGLAPQAYRRLRTVFVGGDAVPEALLADLLEVFPRAEVRVLYGPTEGTIICTSHRVPRDGRPARPLLGRPLGNAELLVCDAAGREVPAGVPGEIWLGGPAVSRGYLNQPELTAERFVERDGGRFFRTGDRARWLEDGTLEFLGRADGQVKLRGLRIELGEIESVLAAHPDVLDVVAMVREDQPGQPRLVAYVRTRELDAPADLAERLRQTARQRLPEYMVPAAFVRIAELPLTAHGKVDRQALPRPEDGQSVAERDDVAPRTDAERELVKIWEEILDVRPIGVRTSFFELGGHSLLSVRLQAEIKVRFGRSLPLEVLFEEPTIERVASWLEGWFEESEGIREKALVPLQPEGEEPPFFCVHPAGGGVQCYLPLASHMGTRQPFLALQAPEIEDPSFAPQASIEEMAANYLEAVRRVQPHGPYHLGGWSFGGLVAFEMAQQLVKAGEEVALLALLDATMPGRNGGAPVSKPAELIAELVASQLRAGTGEPLLAAAELEGLSLDDQLGRALAVLADAGLVGPEVDLASLRRRWEGLMARQQAQELYRARPYRGSVLLVRPEEVAVPGGRQGSAELPVRFWSALALGGIEILRVPGRHATMCLEPNVRHLAVCLVRALAQAAASPVPA